MHHYGQNMLGTWRGEHLPSWWILRRQNTTKCWNCPICSELIDTHTRRILQAKRVRQRIWIGFRVPRGSNFPDFQRTQFRDDIGETHVPGAQRRAQRRERVFSGAWWAGETKTLLRWELPNAASRRPCETESTAEDLLP